MRIAVTHRSAGNAWGDIATKPVFAKELIEKCRITRKELDDKFPPSERAKAICMSTRLREEFERQIEGQQFVSPAVSCFGLKIEIDERLPYPWWGMRMANGDVVLHHAVNGYTVRLSAVIETPVADTSPGSNSSSRVPPAPAQPAL